MALNSLYHDQIDSVQDSFELMELIVSMHKNAVNTNNACKRYLEMVSQISYWLLRECKSQNIPLPKDYTLSKMIEKEGFVIKYPKPTDLLQDKEPTFDVTECGDICRKNIRSTKNIMFFLILSLKCS